VDAGIGIGLLALTVAGFACCYVGFMGLTGKLPRNRWAGIRVGATMASEEAWQAAHRAAGPVMLLGGAAVFAIGLAFFPFAFAGKVDALAGLVVIMVAAGLLLGSMFSALTSALNAANASGTGPGRS
jgi:uncharacterized membrane protein